MVLSYRAFTQWTGSDANAIGKAFLLGDQQLTIRGVLPPGVEFPFPRAMVTFFASDNIGAYVNAAHFDSPNGIMGKLTAGVPPEAARAELEVIRSGVPDKWVLEVRVSPLQAKIVGQAARPLWILLGAVGFVLLIACANVANLLLARASTRQKEVAIRASVGAGRNRVTRQFLAEGVLLALLGGAAGLLLARGGLDVLVRLVPQAVPRLAQASMDARVLGFALVVSLATALLFGLAPVFSLWKVNLHDTLKAGAHSGSAMPRHLRIRKALVAVELAMAVVLLAGAGLMIKSYWRMNSHPPEFEPEKILTLRVPLEGSGYFGNRQRQRAYIEDALQRTRALPGVQAVSVHYGGSAPSLEWDRKFAVESSPTAMTTTSADFLSLMGLRVVRGRWFTDRETEPVMVINEALARRDFPGEDPLRRRMQNRWMVIGVVSDLKYSRLDADPQPEAYFPYTGMQRFDGAGLLVKLATPAAPMAATVTRTVAEVDPSQPVFEVRTMEQALIDSIAPRRFNLFLLGTFAGAALLLAVIGIYGIIAYSVAQRTHEIGVRLALGARVGDVTGMILRQALWIALAGVAAGILAARALTRLMGSLLFDVEPTDPATFVAVTSLLLVTAMLASLAPALRASRVDAVTALRHE